MKLVSYIQKKGIMKVIPENLDDLWVLYNIIHKGDLIYARSTRVVKGEEEAVRPTRGRRISLFLGVRVEKISFQRESDRLRVNGIVIEAQERFSIMGTNHTINIIVGNRISILKEMWLHHDLERIKRASKGANIPIIVVSIAGGDCCVALLRQYGIDVKADITTRFPGKREVTTRSSGKRKNAVSKFFNTILKALELVWRSTNGLIAVIGPGFWKEDFIKYTQIKQPKIFGAIKTVRTVGSGGIAGVKEAIRSGVLDKVAKEISVIEETRTVNKVLSKLGSNQEKVSYGLKNVENAIFKGAVELLLVSNKLLREANDEERRRVEGLMRRVEEMGGKIMIINTEHEAGSQLVGLGGMAAILRFSVTYL